MVNDYSQQPTYAPNFKTPLSVYAAGSAYTLTATSAAVTFGTTSPSLTFPSSGRFLVYAACHWRLNGATFAAVEAVTIQMCKGATPISGWVTAALAPIVTTTDQDGAPGILPPWLFDAAGGDVLNIYAKVAVTPSAGSCTVTESYILALPLGGP
jgi:hypothetical protein